MQLLLLSRHRLFATLRGGFFCKIFMGGMLPVIFCNFFVVRLTNLLQKCDLLVRNSVLVGHRVGQQKGLVGVLWGLDAHFK